MKLHTFYIDRRVSKTITIIWKTIYFAIPKTIVMVARNKNLILIRQVT